MTLIAHIFLSFCILNVFGVEIPSRPENKNKHEKHNNNGAVLNLASVSQPTSDIKHDTIAKDLKESISHKVNEQHTNNQTKAEKDGTKGSVKKQLDSNDAQSSSVNKSKINTEKNPTSDSSQDIETGAVMRGVFVFAAIGILFMTYVAFKTYRRKKSNVLIRKYGIRTRRSDVEMTPLPLEDDDEDETVFEVGNLNRT
ncbi:hypothetical protein JTB14_011839 [Gonioctena quinquepunctata]|nr:hypothetical protein JTB14_011839 [Gonioctena quinquepunctata]